MKVAKLIVQKLTSSIAGLLMLWGFWHLTRWLWPDGLWISVAFFAILAVDLALMVSGIAPRGFRDWPKIGSKK